MHDMNWDNWVMNWFWLLFWCAIFIYASWIVYKLIMGKHIDKMNKSPLHDLKKRLSRGEITKVEYEEAKKALDKDG
ncbi:SHOCT domain-containing protein [Mangrovimonas aestuarii]|uniref:SHOCT domain-containing protein n=1 Tax=Mangrovimonas aestuarii TaxID=3018443 RepID=UPI0023798BCF|nr:SHOCT domain-containing protein [Mangrovimonas aestuarii]